ncbi:MAG TPA: hypothetical protein VFB80_00760, partial [Pirellulaceae bacterium]|nr:hypothetical protein [Pirellulaceae bacterium]
MTAALGVRAASGQYPPPPIPQQPQYQQPQYQQPPQYAQQPQQAAYNLPPASPPVEVFKPAEIMARIGDKCIFYGDVGPTIDLMLDPQLSRIKQELLKKAAEQRLDPAETQEKLAALEREFLRQGRTVYAKPVLEQLVTSKMLYLEFDRQIRKNAKDKYAEARAGIDGKLRSHFEKQLEMCREFVPKAKPEELTALMNQVPVAAPLAALMHNHQLESMSELDAKLRTMGTSLEQQIVQFSEGTLGRETVNRNIDQKPTVTHQEMLDYYE